MKITIPGHPIAKKRHRSAIVKGKVMQYDEQDKEKRRVKEFLKEFIRDVWKCGDKRKAMEMSSLLEAGSIGVNFIFYMPISQGISKVDRGMIEWGTKLHTEKPDVDNLAKFYLDCMNGVLFEDDRAVTKVGCQKRYAVDSRTEIEVVKLRKKVEPDIVDRILAEFTKNELRDIVDIIREIDVLLRAVTENDEEDEETIRRQHEGISNKIIEIEKYMGKFAKVRKLMKGKNE